MRRVFFFTYFLFIYLFNFSPNEQRAGVSSRPMNDIRALYLKQTKLTYFPKNKVLRCFCESKSSEVYVWTIEPKGRPVDVFNIIQKRPNTFVHLKVEEAMEGRRSYKEMRSR